MNRQELRETLTASLCDNDKADEIILLLECGDEKTAVALLEQHRKKMLDEVHSCERGIECLDYLIYKLKEIDLSN